MIVIKSWSNEGDKNLDMQTQCGECKAIMLY